LLAAFAPQHLLRPLDFRPCTGVWWFEVQWTGVKVFTFMQLRV